MHPFGARPSFVGSRHARPDARRVAHPNVTVVPAVTTRTLSRLGCLAAVAFGLQLMGPGCHHAGHRVPASPAEQRCHDGSARGCLEAAEEHDAAVHPETALEYIERACSLGSAEGCFRAGEVSRERAAPRHAELMFHRGCQLGHEPSCEQRGREDVLALLERHPWLWACAREASGTAGDSIPLSLIATETETHSTVALSSPLPGQPELEACIRDVLAATTISTRHHLVHALRIQMDLTLAPEAVDERIAASSGVGSTTATLAMLDSDEEHEAACVDHGTPPCESWPASAVLEHGIYIPEPRDHAIAETHEPGTPLRLSIPIDFCVDQGNGKITEAKVAGPDPSVATSGVLLERVRVWRIRPWSDASEACTRIRYEVRFAWHGYP